MSNKNMRTIDLDELHSELQRTKEQVEAWSRETVQFSSAVKDQHSKRMSTLRGAPRPLPRTRHRSRPRPLTATRPARCRGGGIAGGRAQEAAGGVAARERA